MRLWQNWVFNSLKNLAKAIIAANPGGIRYSASVDRISEQHPETLKNTIHGSVWNLDALFSITINETIERE